ncbi:hypothetical protein PG994_003021 [Apiospora phragmitis]|uniref:RING-type domain-containing protein n=1 Tax=Apiospora phragmitis TaxID=2905665 RepID=A0ABR1W6V3_9PEZI
MIKKELLAADPVDTKEKFYKKFNLERSVFLRCGHIMGKSCYEQIQVQPSPCPVCRADNTCDGCHVDQVAFATWTFVPWPLSIANFQPCRRFMSAVPLTAAEIAPGTKRFCGDCIKVQVIRQWARLALMCPTCPACDAAHEDREGATAAAATQYPEDHRVWRDANVVPWIRRQVGILAELVYPSRADLRDRELVTRVDEPALATRRAAFVAHYMDDQDLVGPVGRIVFQPCEQTRALGEEGTAPYSQAEYDRLSRAMLRILNNGYDKYSQTFIEWYRGDEEFKLPTAEDPRDSDNQRKGSQRSPAPAPSFRLCSLPTPSSCLISPLGM